MNYNPIGTSVAEIAERVVRRVHKMRQRIASAKVHLVGHSLGGVIVRYAVSALGLEAHTAAAITIASPHRGIPLAGVGIVGRLCGVRNAIADIAPGAAVLSQLDRRARRSEVRWTAYYSNLDLVVPPHAARLTVPALRATNIEPDTGHVGLLLAPRLLSSILTQLRAADTLGPRTMPVTQGAGGLPPSCLGDEAA